MSKKEYRVRCSQSCFNTGKAGSFHVEVYEPVPFQFSWKVIKDGFQNIKEASAWIKEQE